MTDKNQKMKSPHSPHRRLPIILTLVAVAALSGLCLGVYLWLYTPLPTLDGFAAYLPPSSQYTPVPLEAISPAAQQVTVAIEQPNFYASFSTPIKPADVMRGIMYRWRCSHSSCLADGYTIPQGVATRWLLVTQSDLSRSFRREMREMFLTIRITRRYTPDETLTLYLNQMPYGSGIYGIEAAAQHYFNKSAADLTLGEAAALHYLADFPTTSDPAQIRNGQTLALNWMVEQGFITQEQAQQAQEENLPFIDPGLSTPPIR